MVGNIRTAYALITTPRSPYIYAQSAMNTSPNNPLFIKSATTLVGNIGTLYTLIVIPNGSYTYSQSCELYTRPILNLMG